MKNVIFILVSLVFFNFGMAQDQPEVGDILVIETPHNNKFKYLDVPKLNILVKRGHIPNYKSVYGNNVVVRKVTEGKDGTVNVVLERKNGTKFFGFMKQIKANYSKAIKANELSFVRS